MRKFMPITHGVNSVKDLTEERLKHLCELGDILCDSELRMGIESFRDFLHNTSSDNLELVDDYLHDYALEITDSSLYDYKNVKRLMGLAEKDRFALIFESKNATVVKRHLSAFNPKLTRVTGLLAKRTGTRTFYHKTTADRMRNILAQGFDCRQDDRLTFGGGVVYTYPSITPFLLLPVGFALVEIEYSGPYLEALIEYDKPEVEQGECLLYPEYIQSLRFDVIDHTKMETLKKRGDSV